jgi:hypothetical protein
MTDRAHDALTAQVLTELLQASHLMAPAELPVRITGLTAPLGITTVRIYLADLRQQWLRAIADPAGPALPDLRVDSTLAGRAYQTVTIQETRAEGPADGRRMWVPLVDGTERLGVMEVVIAHKGEEDEAAYRALLGSCRMLSSLTALIIVSKSAFSDTYRKIRRQRAMAVQAELAWAFLPPRTFSTGTVTLAASLEPAYEIGGDAFDYALFGDRLHASIFDSVGHDLTAGLISSVAMASCRTARRAGGDLLDIAAGIDRAIAGEFGHARFVTALLCELDTATGRFIWLPCGHPGPLLIRGGKVIKHLTGEPGLPLGLADLARNGRLSATVHTERLQPGDRLLLYTDGVVEARGADGGEFGAARLGDFVIRNSAEGMPPPETLRRLTQAILDYQQGRLRDDATVVMLEWIPQDPERQLTV